MHKWNVAIKYHLSHLISISWTQYSGLKYHSIAFKLVITVVPCTGALLPALPILQAIEEPAGFSIIYAELSEIPLKEGE